ncbi:hypothetical protein CW751_05980 [Brumimicrobium salinarum]|uniref:Lysylphosphatidylglycerol synthetase family protein n=1 Tax=Brumimicrobium salinarum TaxID=2058658 RepID=A0A2I0R405_9FLAO|nr:lysylphosphatidylglycerol synthase domain-containing protein [Brumimicrobium salinarum]PKR81130.1 hypothetical protein CW751_05980 [Brumimicrobium salinarum]
MSNFKNIKVRKSLVWFLKLTLFLGLCIIFIQQLLSVDWNAIQSAQIKNPLFFLFCVLLLPLNWGLEMLKWKSILRITSSNYNLSSLFKSLLSGISTGLITPNRIGNFIGRSLFFKGKQRANLILGTLYGNFAQFLSTLIFGCIGILLIGNEIASLSNSNSNSNSISITFIFLFTLCLLFYFLVPFFPIQKVRFFNAKQNILVQFQDLCKGITFPLLFLSLVRFLVFVSQYALILIAFGVDLSFSLISGIFLVYLLSTLTPSIFFSKIIVRESAAIFVLSHFVDQTIIIVFSSLLLWIINLGIPSLLGMVYLFRHKSLANA